MNKSHVQIIWIDEDERNKEEVLFDSLKELYEEVVFFKNPDEGLSYILENIDKPMIVILDINMPQINGHVICSRVRENSKLIPIILFTGVNENNEPLSDFIDNHVFAFIKKDTDLDTIMAKVKEAEMLLVTQADGLIEDALEEWLQIQENRNLDEPLLIQAGGRSYSINEILDEVRLKTPFGRTFMKDVVSLTIDLILRGKRNLP
ncbi:MAG: response regulator [Sphingobacteriales bacterium]|nr:MAG: response regulator [Sphingobacteriales bacterium]